MKTCLFDIQKVQSLLLRSKYMGCAVVFTISALPAVAQMQGESKPIFKSLEEKRVELDGEDLYPESSFGGPSQAQNRTLLRRELERMDRKMSSDSLSIGASSVDSQSDAKARGEARRKGIQEVALIASDLGFFPKVVFVNRETQVRIFVTGASKNTLCFMMDAYNVRKQVRTQKIEEIVIQPSVPGIFRFYCPINGAEGSLVVKELSSDLPKEMAKVEAPSGVNAQEKVKAVKEADPSADEPNQTPKTKKE